MAKSGPIIIVEDDIDDKSILEEIFNDLEIKNEFVWFKNAPDAFNFLKETASQPFLIFCDVNLPRQTGIEFKRQIDSDPELRKKSIPFVFFSTSVNQEAVNQAYTQMTVQGFFQKSSSYQEIRNNVKVILDYWFLCKHPNTK
jgi:CheY-like chemotaxis protein